MRLRDKIIYPAAFFAATVFVAEGVSGFTSAQLSLFYNFLTVSASAFFASLVLTISSLPLFLNKIKRKRPKKYKIKNKENYW